MAKKLSKSQRFIRIGLLIVSGWALFLFASGLVKSLINPSNDSNIVKIDLDEFSLETLTDEQIIYGKQYRAYRYSGQNIGKSTGVGGRFEKVDCDKSTMTVKKITGVCVRSATKIKDSTLHLTIESTLNSGEMKIVVIRDEEIIEYLEVGQTHNLVYDVEGEHIYYVKFLCVEANTEVSVLREIADE